MATKEDVVAKYVELRDRKSTLKKQYDDDVAVIDNALDQLEVWLKTKMFADGETSVKTNAGTAFIAYKESATVADFDAVWEYAVSNNCPHIFEKRVNKTTVRELMIQTNSGYENAPPPGVNFVRTEEIQVRRPTKK